MKAVNDHAGETRSWVNPMVFTAVGRERGGKKETYDNTVFIRRKL
jgi:hypothetical protein